MKHFFIVVAFLISYSALSQNNHIVKTEDGRRVLLKADFTWEYIDLEAPKNTQTSIIAKNSNTCNLPADFNEPKLDKKIQTQLKKGRATINHIKKRVAKDYKCTVNDVILISVKESKATAIYNFCANGTKTTYKRTGHSFAKKLDIF